MSKKKSTSKGVHSKNEKSKLNAQERQLEKARLREEQLALQAQKREELMVLEQLFCNMSSSSDEDDIIDYYQYRRNRKVVRREYWTHPYIEKNLKCRLFIAAEQLNQTDAKFIAFYRMSKDSYQELVKLVVPNIHKMDTNMRECVSPEERILITLRYLATGITFVSLSLYFARGETTVGNIVHETTKIIWDTLHATYMPVPTREHWKLIADRFESIWNLPNCIGAIDGKHVRIEKFPKTGLQNYNYKSYHSVVLMAYCDADGLFTMVESGYAGRNSDGGIFKASAMTYWITHGGFDIPSPSPFTHDDTNCPFPYYFAADEAFPLSRYLLRPYSKRALDNVKIIFNYRLSRGRKTIECTFGMASEKFQVLNGPIRCRKVEVVNDIIKAVCILHNYVHKREGINYRPNDTQEDNEIDAVPINTITPREITTDDSSSAIAIRNYLSNYFLSFRGSLPWQWKYTVPEIGNIQ